MQINTSTLYEYGYFSINNKLEARYRDDVLEKSLRVERIGVKTDLITIWLGVCSWQNWRALVVYTLFEIGRPANQTILILMKLIHGLL